MIGKAIRCVKTIKKQKRTTVLQLNDEAMADDTAINTDTNRYQQALRAYEARLQAIGSEEMVINMGPQHPSTHGVLRLQLITDGEIVKEVIPHLGYLHRCFEKHAESMNYGKTIPFTDRMDYLASMNNSHAFVMGVERMLGIEREIPKRVEYIRVLVCELNRIASHLIAIGTYGIDIGAFTPFMWCFRD